VPLLKLLNQQNIAPVNNFKSEDKTIYVLHQLEVESHYEGLKYFCNSIGYQFKFLQFSWSSQILSGIKHFNRNKRFTAGLYNLYFLLKLPFMKRRNIVLGIAPYDYRMVFFNWLGKRHNLFYHTSWPYWDQSNFPENKFHSGFKSRIMNAWASFLQEDCKGIFCVSQFTLDQLRLNYDIKCPASVVYHSINKDIFYPPASISVNEPVKFIFAGRLIESKGIPELLKISDELADTGFNLGIAGGNVLAKQVEEDTANKPHVTFYGKVKREELGNLYRQYDFLLCPSKREQGWEELFGISIIEAMCCGCIPVATNHVGPKEIITDGVNGFFLNNDTLYPDLEKMIAALMQMDKSKIVSIKANAIIKGQQYYNAQIATRWSSIMDKFINIQ
jgi:glycosyltransferase involved in cell wall biosynthesis